MASITSPGVIQIAALGRPFSLGSLYDCHTESVGATLWDSDILANGLGVQSQNKVDYKFYHTDSLTDKSNALNLNPGLKMSVLSRLVVPSGTAKYFDDRTSSSTQARVTLSYKYTTKLESLTLSNLGMEGDKCPPLSAFGSATHIVIGILYGGQAFFVFDKQTCKEKAVDSSWHNIIELIPYTEVDSGGFVKLSDEQKHQTDFLSIEYYGDFELAKTPTTYEEVVRFWQSLPTLLGKDNEKAVPITVWLYPLCRLNNQASKLMHEVSAYLAHSVEKVLEELHQLYIKCNDICKSSVGQRLPGFQREVRRFQELISEHRVHLQKEMSQAVLKTRRGDTEENELAMILDRKEESPFRTSEISNWLQNAELETKIVQQCLQKINGLQFVSGHTAFQAYCTNPANKDIVCLKILRPCNDPLLVAMESYLKETVSNGFKNMHIGNVPTFVNESIRHSLIKNTRALLECHDVNTTMTSTRYVIAEELSDKGVSCSLICMYKDGSEVNQQSRQASTEPQEAYPADFLKVCPPIIHQQKQQHQEQPSKQESVSGQCSQRDTVTNNLGAPPVSSTGGFGTPPPYELLPSPNLPDRQGEQMPQNVSNTGREVCTTPWAFQQGDESQHFWMGNSACGSQGSIFPPAYADGQPQSRMPSPGYRPSPPPWVFYGGYGSTSQSWLPGGYSSHPWMQYPGYGQLPPQWMVHPAHGLPSKPDTPFVAQRGHDTITLKWEKAASRENIVEYEVLCQESGGPQKTLKTGDNSAEYTITNLKAGCTYKFKIRSCSEMGKSEFCDLADDTMTLPTSPPGKPKAKKVNIYKATLKWDKPKIIGEKVTIHCFVVLVQIDENEEWIELTTVPGGCTSTEFGIKPNVAYKFKVMTDCLNHGRSDASEESEELNNAVSGLALVKAVTKAEVKQVEEGSPTVYQLFAKNTFTAKCGKIKKFELGKENKVSQKTEKVILVVGATGSGKTTLINGMVNYIYGIDWNDNCRVKLIVETTEGKIANQALSQTSGISSYTLHHQNSMKIPFTLTIIDTPGFGDTTGILRDKEITEQIRQFFTNPGEGGVDHLDAVGFVAQASLPRLTPTQRYIFDSILALFGKDIAGNIFMLLTFADGQKPPVLDGLKEAELPYQKCFKFNNSALFADTKGNYLSTNGDENEGGENNTEEDDSEDDDEDEDNFDEMFWKMGVKSFKQFLDSLNRVESKTLALTRDVLNERQRLEVSVQGIQQDIQIGLNKLEQLQQEVQVLKAHEADIDKNKDFEYTVHEEAAELAPIDPGTYTTNCLVCKRTCHYPCGIRDDADKAGCWAMTNGNCRICPANCCWDIHKNLPHKYEIKRVAVKKTAGDLKARYEEAQGKKLTAQQLVENVLNEFDEIQLKVLGLTEEVRLSLKRLKEIALKPSPLSTTEYIDILIESEQAETKPGWKERVEQLQQVRKQAECMMKLADQGYDPFEKYREKLDEAKKKKKSFWNAAGKILNPAKWFK